MRHLLTFHVCTTLCLQLIFGSFLTGSFLPSILIAPEDWDAVFQDCCVRRFRPSVWRWIPLTDRLGRTDLHYRNQEIIVSVLCARFIWLLAFSTTESSPRRQTSTTSALLQETQCARTHSWTLNRCDTDSMRRRNLLVWVHGPSCSTEDLRHEAASVFKDDWRDAVTTLPPMFGQARMLCSLRRTCSLRSWPRNLIAFILYLYLSLRGRRVTQ